MFQVIKISKKTKKEKPVYSNENILECNRYISYIGSIHSKTHDYKIISK